MTINQIADDLEDICGHFCEDAVAALRRLQIESEISDTLIKHLHSENVELRKENEQLQIEISTLKEDNKFISQYLCTPQLGVIKND